jgi:hypothetical protein
MSLIPKLRITKENEISAIRENQQLNRLPDDVTEIIIAYFGHEIEMDDVDTFWISLGIDTCNIEKLRCHCRNILLHSFGRLKPDILCNLFKELRNKLDDMIVCNYPNDIKTISFEEDKFISINNVFICDNALASPNPYPDVKSTVPKTKSITSQDKEYIETFIKKTNIYLNYLKDNVHLFPVDLTVHQLRREKLEHHCNREVIKTANKIERKINKLSIMMCDINIQD